MFGSAISTNFMGDRRYVTDVTILTEEIIWQIITNRLICIIFSLILNDSKRFDLSFKSIENLSIQYEIP